MSNQVVADLNNTGVSLVHSGDLDRAIGFFRDALKKALIVLRSPSITEDQLLGKESFVRSTMAPPSISIGAWTDDEFLKAEVSLTFAPGSSGAVFLHLSPISIEGTPGAYSNDSLLTTSIMSAIVLCNIGIIYHLKSLEERSCEDIASQLFKARGLYEKAHLLLRESVVWGGATGNPTVDLLFMAVANNLGQVSFDLSCFDDSKHYYNILRDFCMTVVPTVYADLGTATFLNQERNKFLLNALLKSYPTMAAAA